MRTRAKEHAHGGHARKRTKSRALALSANKKGKEEVKEGGCCVGRSITAPVDLESMHGRCSKRRRSTRQRSGRCFDCCSRPLCLHRASTRPAIPRASWTVERLIDRSDVETTAPEGKREYAGAVEASCAATEPSRAPRPYRSYDAIDRPPKLLFVSVQS